MRSTGPASAGSEHWHALGSSSVLATLETSEQGLSEAEAEERRRRHGPNRLVRAAPSPVLHILLRQFRSVVVLLLVVALLISALLGQALEAGAIGAVLVINALIGFTVELRARRAMDAILMYSVPTARVVRAGDLQVVSAEELVPGDVIRLEEGDGIPADARILRSSELRTAEAPLTGESAPVDKDPEAESDPTTPIADRSGMLYAGTTVVGGRGTAVVVATASDMEIGRIGRMIMEVEAERTPLEDRLDSLGRRLAWLAIGVGGLVVGFGALRGVPLGQTLETGIALAIAAVPEGLPAVATIALAVGMKRMLRREAVVRRLTSVEALGATTVVCTDKTGTLTAGEMTVTRISLPERVIEVDGAGYSAVGGFSESGSAVRVDDPDLRAFLEAAALTGRAQVDLEAGTCLGDPTDAALIVVAAKAGMGRLEEEEPVREVPFSSERKFSASVHRSAGEFLTVVKGSPPVVLERCDRVLRDGEEQPLEEGLRESLLAQNQRLAEGGLRVIALARHRGDDLEAPLVFLGLAGLLDPPAEGVKETIAALREAGIRTVTITGDQEATAVAVAREIGAFPDGARTVDGRALASMPDRELSRIVGEVAVFSRVDPGDKVRIVAALQEHGEIVAMLGDGVNDAPALKKSDVGVAMGGRGTDVAKETAAIVLRDDRFTTIRAAVEEGRTIFDNIRRFVFYLFSCNLAEVSVVLGASALAIPLPLLPLQILWLNLVTDTFPALALALEPAEPGIMRRPPRDPSASILSRSFMGTTAAFSLLITAATLAVFLLALRTRQVDYAVTMAFMTLAFAQLFHLQNARSGRSSGHGGRRARNPWAAGAFVLVVGLQMLAVYFAPLALVLGTTPLSATDWGWVLAFSVLPLLIGSVVERLRGQPAI